MTVEEVLGRAGARIAGKFKQQPRIELEVQLTIGVSYRILGNYPAAQPHLERAVELGRRVFGEEYCSQPHRHGPVSNAVPGSRPGCQG